MIKYSFTASIYGYFVEFESAVVAIAEFRDPSTTRSSLPGAAALVMLPFPLRLRFFAMTLLTPVRPVEVLRAVGNSVLHSGMDEKFSANADVLPHILSKSKQLSLHPAQAPVESAVETVSDAH